MSERVVIVSIPGVNFCCDGYCNREEAITKFRENAERQKQEAERWLAISDNELIVFRCNGPHAQRNRVELSAQQSKGGEG